MPGPQIFLVIGADPKASFGMAGAVFPFAFKTRLYSLQPGDAVQVTGVFKSQTVMPELDGETVSLVSPNQIPRP